MPALSGNVEFAVLLCKFEDVQEEPRTTDWFEAFLNGDGNGSVRDYWRDASLEKVSLEFDIFDWSVIPQPIEAYKLVKPDRFQKIVGVFSSFPSFNLADYDGVIAIFNTREIGTSGTVTPNKIAAHPDRLNVTWFSHEVGHVLGLGHSFDDSNRKNASWASPGQYFHEHDIMSAMNVHTFTHPEFGPSGPLCCTALLDACGWIDEERIWRDPENEAPDAEIDLVSLSHPEVPGYLAAEFCGLHIEFRTAEKWDRDIPRNAVLIQLLRETNAIVLSSDHAKNEHHWLPGMKYPIVQEVPPPYLPNLDDLFGSSGSKCEIEIISFNSETHKARIRLRKIAGDSRRPLVVGPAQSLGGSVGTGGGGFVLLPGGQIVPIPPRDPSGGWRVVAFAALAVAALSIFVLAATVILPG